MKITIATTWVLGFGLSLAPLLASAQQASKTIRESYETAGSGTDTFVLRNINGAVSVEGYDGSEILLTAEVTYKAKSRRNVDKAQEEVTLATQKVEGALVIYVDAPGVMFNTDDGEYGYQMNRWDPDYSFTFNFKVKVPRRLAVNVGTIQEGDVTVKNIASFVKACNINGDVYLSGISGPGSEATTINGDVTALYEKVPVMACEYHTINGTIEVQYPTSLAAQMAFESFNGSFFTDFDYQALPTKLVKTEEDEPGSFRLESRSSIQVGDGGPVISFNNFNGNTYIRKKD